MIYTTLTDRAVDNLSRRGLFAPMIDSDALLRQCGAKLGIILRSWEQRRLHSVSVIQ
jgi:hypothetical protein